MKGNFLDKIFGFMGLSDNIEIDDMQYDDEYEEYRKEPGKTQRTGKIINIHNKRSDIKINVIEPEEYEDVLEISENLKKACAVIINLKNMDINDAVRMIDFLSGLVYAINGSIKKIENSIFLVVPAGVDISGGIGDIGIEDIISPLKDSILIGEE
ncbi:MAG TPA: cell division protein SepF [Thermoanaerobacterales bacterium]|nr:cell division protein SepF [Thermoanaerobacterales bacterium]